MKDLFIVAYGPERLAASTVAGTRRGPKKNAKEDAEPKPGLDKAIYDRVRSKFQPQMYSII